MVAIMKDRVREGLPHPRGATWDGEGVNFSLFSANATKVELCLFDADGKSELERIELPEYTDQFFHGWVGDVGPGQVYGYRISPIVHLLFEILPADPNGPSLIPARHH